MSAEIGTGGQSRAETHVEPAPGAPSTDGGHGSHDTQLQLAPVGPSASSDQTPLETHGLYVAAGTPSEPPAHSANGTHLPPDGWLELRIWAEMFDDAQRARIANVNRAERGGVDADIYAPFIEQLQTSEKVVGRHLTLCYRRVVPESIRQWVKETRGLGEASMALLLGHIGHPRYATPHHWHVGAKPEGHVCGATCGSGRHLVDDAPFERTVSQLWQYCGHGKPVAKRPKGAPRLSQAELMAQGSPKLKTLVWRVAESAVKGGVRKYPDATEKPYDPADRYATSHYGDVYLRERKVGLDKEHTVECVRCGPSGRPAQPGSPWSSKHQHAHALRIVGKEILRDLWSLS